MRLYGGRGACGNGSSDSLVGSVMGCAGMGFHGSLWALRVSCSGRLRFHLRVGELQRRCTGVGAKRAFPRPRSIGYTPLRGQLLHP